MPTSIVPPDLRNILGDLARRIGILERRIIPRAEGTGGVGHTHDGADGSKATVLTGPSSDAAAVASGFFALAGGDNAIASGDNSTALGPGAEASGTEAVALGRSVGAVAYRAVSLGSSSWADGSSAAAVGPSADAGGEGAIAAGFGASASGLRSSALGPLTTAAGAYSTAIGVGAATDVDHQIAVGSSDDVVVIYGRLVVKDVDGGGYHYLDVSSTGVITTSVYP